MPRPMLKRDMICSAAQGWASRTSWAEIARWRMAVFQSVPVGGHLDVAQDQVDDAVEDVVLVGHVVVQRHRLDPELLAEPAHGQRLDPALVGQGDGGAQHPLPAQRGSPLGVRTGLCRHRDPPGARNVQRKPRGWTPPLRVCTLHRKRTT